jgi:hypothetical protein
MLELLTPADRGVVFGFRPPTRSVGSDKSAERATGFGASHFRFCTRGCRPEPTPNVCDGGRRVKPTQPKLDFYLENDPREKALRDAVYRAIGRARRKEE